MENNNFDLAPVNEQKKENLFIRIIKRVFVHNIGYKALALVLSVCMWLIIVGLGG